MISEQNVQPTSESGNSTKPVLYAVPPERTYQLVKAVLDHLSSRLNQDCIPTPSLNSVAVLAADILKELREGHSI